MLPGGHLCGDNAVMAAEESKDESRRRRVGALLASAQSLEVYVFPLVHVGIVPSLKEEVERVSANRANAQCRPQRTSASAVFFFHKYSCCAVIEPAHEVVRVRGRHWHGAGGAEQGTHVHSQPLLAACMLLACKCEDTPRKLGDVGTVVDMVLRRSTTPVPIGSTYHTLKDRVVWAEQLLVQTIGFVLHVPHPYQYLLNFVRALRGAAAAGVGADHVLAGQLQLTHPPRRE